MKNLVFTITFVMIFLFLPFILYSQIYLSNKGTVTFLSEAPLETITATSEQVQCAVNTDDLRFAFKIQNKSFIGFNSPLQQEHFYENYIETDKYTYSTFQGKIIEKINKETAGEQKVRAKGVLSIHGVDVERIINATIEFTDGEMALKSNFQISLEDHNIRIPNVVNQKIAEVIEVSVKARLEEKTD